MMKQAYIRENQDVFKAINEANVEPFDVTNIEVIDKIQQSIKIKPFDMTNVLNECLTHLPSLLRNRKIWKSLLVNHKPPHLLRIYTQIGKIRINLHYFIPSNRNTSGDIEYFHPHAWASCMKILHGHYRQLIGFAQQRGLENPPDKILHLHHNKNDTYAMNNPYLWHQVVPPNDEPGLTMMVTFIPDNWDQDSPKSEIILRELNNDEFDFMIDIFLCIIHTPYYIHRYVSNGCQDMYHPYIKNLQKEAN